jgi:tRNA(Ile)-lysidine synthase
MPSAEGRAVDDTPVLIRALAPYLRQTNGSLVIAISGGPDSVALARAAALAREHRSGRLVFAHLNHGLRGTESDADEAFVIDLAAQIPGVEICHVRIDVAAEAARTGMNLEATARRLRYDWLAQVARERGITRVATGHTADDQAETVLHRLLRGTGLQGLRGIAGRRALAPDVELVRPILDVTRVDVLAFLHSLGQSFREDSSNRDLRHTRNRIRHELLPLLAGQFNPAIVAVLGRLAAQAEEAFRDEESAASRLLTAAELPRAGRQVVFDAVCLRAAPERELRAMLRLVWEREGWPRDAMSFDTWKRLAASVHGKGTATDFPGGIHASHRGRAFLLGPG